MSRQGYPMSYYFDYNELIEVVEKKIQNGDDELVVIALLQEYIAQLIHGVERGYIDGWEMKEGTIKPFKRNKKTSN